MLVAEEAVEIRDLSGQGKSTSEIARTLKVSRDTVRHYLMDEWLPRYQRCSDLRQSGTAPSPTMGVLTVAMRDPIFHHDHRQRQWRELQTQGQAQGGSAIEARKANRLIEVVG